MQTLEEGVIQLPGKGFVARSSEEYGPGEYKALENLNLSPRGTLKKRRPIQGLMHDRVNNLHKFIGNAQYRAVIATFNDTTHVPTITHCDDKSTSVYAIAAGVQANLDIASPLPAGTWTNKGYQFEGFFQYGTDDYYITANLGIDVTTIAGSHIHGYSINVMKASIPVQNAYVSPLAFTLGNMGAKFTESAATVVSAAIIWRLRSLVSSFLVHKERLYVAVEDVVYFSKATDPLKFSIADDGGFIKFPGKYIKKIVSLGDLIYVIFDSSVSVIGYTTSPNTDLQVREISSAVGGEDAIAVGDTVYLAKPNAIYAINGNNISKALDLDLDYDIQVDVLTGTSAAMGTMKAYQFKLEAFDNKLYLGTRQVVTVDASCHLYSVKYIGNLDFPFAIDLDTGFTSKQTFYRGTVARRIADMRFIPVEDKFNQSKLVYLATDDSGTFCYAFHHGTRQPFQTLTTVYANPVMFGWDTHSNDAGTTLQYSSIPILMHISGYSPDDMKYINKKFRSLELQMDIPMALKVALAGFEPEIEFIVSAGRANLNIPAAGGEAMAELLTGVIQTNSSGLENPADITAAEQQIVGYRYGVNQRATSIDLLIRTIPLIKQNSNNVVNIQGFNATEMAAFLRNSNMEIVDIRTLWTPTRRGRTNDTRSLS